MTFNQQPATSNQQPASSIQQPATSNQQPVKVGITGQSGFMGTHLFNYLGLKDNIKRILFKDEYFESEQNLQNFVKQCDVVVHLAAMNRHGDPKVIYNTNIELVNKLVKALENTNSTPHVIFSSSTQEEKDNLYGKSKREGRKLLDDWAKRNKAKFIGLIIPNVFGPFGNPYYNSVIATFSHQLTHNEQPEIHVDGRIKLIYINELTEFFYKVIKGIIKENPYLVPYTTEKKVSEILQLLNLYKSEYFDKGIIPALTDPFELALFNTFICYMPEEHFPVKLTKHTDKRGAFVEVVKSETPGQFSFSTTRPGITRGNHFHTRKAERFTVIKGEAIIRLRKIGTDNIIEYKLSGDQPAFVDMPVWFTHNITNSSNEDLLTLFWINEPYNPEDPDTYFEEV